MSSNRYKICRQRLLTQTRHYTGTYLRIEICLQQVSPNMDVLRAESCGTQAQVLTLYVNMQPFRRMSHS